MGSLQHSLVGSLAMALLAVSCGGSNGGAASGASGNAGVAGNAGAAGSAPSGGTSSGVAGSATGGASAAAGNAACQGPSCGSGGTAQLGSAAATQACRDYFTTVCARIRECGAPSFRPCESPTDACPDILFSDGSAWTVEQALDCTEQWKTHDCAALAKDQGPACSQVVGARPLGSSCLFDAQCQSGLCNGGVVPEYNASCGTCAEVAPSLGACDSQHVCPTPQTCEAGTCVGPSEVVSIYCSDTIACPGDLFCYRGECTPFVPAGSKCTYYSECVAGHACQIELGLDPEPVEGICAPLPAIGQKCLPTFQASGVCADGGTCTGRPTGNCVPLRQVGEDCGFTQCVEGAYCQVWGYDSLPSHFCYARANEGEACPHEGSNHGDAACSEGLFCVCATPGACATGVCSKPRSMGQSCNDTSELCASGLLCSNGVCAKVVQNPPGGTTPAGAACVRSTALGREVDTCSAGLECLCPDATCTAPICATPRNPGESCDGPNQICRQGLTCTEGACAVVTDRHLESQACAAQP